MENLAKSLENKQILVIDAVTLVDHQDKKSRICNKKILLSEIKKDYFIKNLDGDDSYVAEFDIITIDGKYFKPEFHNNKIKLWAKTYRAKNIDIEEFKVL